MGEKRRTKAFFRRAALYPAELRALGVASIAEFRFEGKRRRAQTCTSIGSVGIRRLDEGSPMPHCPTFAAQEERLARFRFHLARRLGSIRVFGWLRACRGGRTGEFRQRRVGRPDPGAIRRGRRERVHSRPSSFCTPVLACRQSALPLARGSRLGSMSPCSSTILHRAAARSTGAVRRLQASPALCRWLFPLSGQPSLRRPNADRGGRVFARG